MINMPTKNETDRKIAQITTEHPASDFDNWLALRASPGPEVLPPEPERAPPVTAPASASSEIFGTVIETITGLPDNFDKFDGALAKSAERHRELKDALKDTNDRITPAETRLTATEGRIAKLEERQAELERALANSAGLSASERSRLGLSQH